MNNNLAVVTLLLETCVLVKSADTIEATDSVSNNLSQVLEL